MEGSSEQGGVWKVGAHFKVRVCTSVTADGC
jgi:hypothetical protein